MELVPKTGIGALQFGMRQKDVASILGNPDKQFKDDDQNVIYVYNESKLRLTFYEDEGFRFGYLICADERLTLFGESVIGKKTDEVKSKLPEKTFKNWETEDFDLAENHFNESNWLILQSEFGLIAKVELGATINDKDEIEWKFK